VDYSTLQSRTLARLNMSTNDPAAANVDEYVNEALHYLETASPDGWPWMRTTINTTISAASYTFTQLSASQTVAKVLSVKVLANNTYYPLGLRSQDELDQLYPIPSSTGTPESFNVEGQSLYVYPTPETSYTARLRVIVTEPDLGGNTSTPVIPVVFHSAVVEAALLLMYETLQDETRRATQEKKVGMWVDRMRRYGMPYESSPKIRVREWL